ncbi:MAG: monovalent cation/H(+) antiporter subunit G [Clostridiales bacterium]|jgi:multicomponent Na+:H+ antiporter subunit G|nr:monovalent cation/H(+) antiporter subunit G [Clostridiales bacterium]
MNIMEIISIIGSVVMGIGIAFMVFGVVCIFLLKDFYPRILVASKIDTVGLLTFLLGVCLQHGFSFFSAKVLLIVVIILILNPLVAHIVARSAYLSGYQLEGSLTRDAEALVDRISPPEEEEHDEDA